MKKYLFVFICCLFLTQYSVAQMRMIRANPDSSMILMEIGANIKTTSTGIIVEEVLDFHNKQVVDIKVNDIIFGINGKRTPEIKAFREIYAGVKTDEEVKIGIERNGQKMLVRFKKAERPSGGKMVMNMDSDGPDGGMEPSLLELGILGEFTPKGILVKSILPIASESTKKEIQKDDVIEKVNDKKITRPLELEAVLEKLKVNDEIIFTLTRAGKSLTVKTTKSKAQFSIQRN